jgi:Holliday junction resolvase RusA-like endonuclease
MRIVVYGDPAPQGSKRFVRALPNGRGIMKEQSTKVDPWRQDVRQAAQAALFDAGWPEPFQGAVVVRMVFTFNRPATVKRSKRPWPSVSPDLSKLARSTEDALTGAGIWRDDALVVEYTRLAKVYAGEDEEALDRPGALILVGELVDLVPVEGGIPGRSNGRSGKLVGHDPGGQAPVDLGRQE